MDPRTLRLLALLAVAVPRPTLAQGAADTTPPWIDLAGDPAHTVVVERKAGQYLGHPTTVLLEDGRTLLVAYPEGHGKGAIVLKRSQDGGATWSERLPTPQSFATSQEVPTLHRVVGPDGTKRIVLFSGLYPIRMAHSEDDGATWSELAPIGDYGGIVAMASVERARNGDYLAFFHDDGRFLHGAGQRGPFTVYSVRSKDGGLSWSEPQTIVSSSEVDLCEPGCVRSPDGRTLALLLRENSRKQPAHLVLSDDEGSTWSAPRSMHPALTGDRHVGRYDADGRLFLSFRDTGPGSPTYGDWLGWVGTFEDLVEGRPGQYRVRLGDNLVRADCAYPGVERLPGGTFVVTTYGHWTEGQEPWIACVRFTLAELDARLVGR